MENCSSDGRQRFGTFSLSSEGNSFRYVIPRIEFFAFAAFHYADKRRERTASLVRSGADTDFPNITAIRRALSASLFVGGSSGFLTNATTASRSFKISFAGDPSLKLSDFEPWLEALFGLARIGLHFLLPSSPSATAFISPRISRRKQSQVLPTFLS
jgi:hypothetical protein